jgi:TRAP-type mannitol/chloroaromatic compound transport system substrate-binding protein
MKKALTIILSLVVALSLTGCLSEKEQASSNSDSSSAPAGKTFNWVMQTTWSSGTMNFWYAQQFAEDVKKMSGGRLNIDVKPDGAVVKAFDTLDAVHNGTVEMAHAWDGYWMGQMPAAAFFAATPGGMGAQEYTAWILDGEGMNLWQEMYDNGGYNVHVVPGGVITPEVMYHSNEPITTLEDIKGKKVRGVGFWGELEDKLGASVVALPGSEVYQALERGVVDAAEFSAPNVNLDLGFHEVSDYIVGPGIHQLTSLYSVTVNKDKWNELPEDLQNIVRVAGENLMGRGWARSVTKDMEAMKTFKKLEEEGKVEILEFNKEDQQKIAEMAEELFREKAKQDDFVGKVVDSQLTFLEDYRYWKNIMVPDIGGK